MAFVNVFHSPFVVPSLARTTAIHARLCPAGAVQFSDSALPAVLFGKPSTSDTQDNTMEAPVDLDWLLNNQELDYGTPAPLMPGS
ncbi:uncharacterized protein TRIVIDRAFT_222327 [Trichoderma virens Gv29-8]|uniref:Uncharacterized protein n=1 Tax=Hypocrea virens (strain Gv29-8 / FGSC 10586) TaxID=413071 RepID=G9MSX1_HYPVG|nr:uncharacterized protein TRIVIDRAFT_222327 [Trichoderma virens Gv29-8]EHK23068.1 hypothetical protein TRIVIDRAFT_222327 [Trichoderma virens Gv29-8]UKZ48128.1 hypothetical protein TrVGV298_002364 [Trichoderma virens]